MTYDNNNIFAKILRGEIPSTPIYENEYVLAFYDIAPLAPVHILIIPKGAYVSLQDFSEKASAQEITEFYRAVPIIAQQEGIADQGYRAITNIGEHGGQEIPHFHLHLLGGEKIGSLRP